MIMNTMHFRYAVEIARTGSITQAADNLFMSQPNLSKAVKELEETLGITIFKRTPKGVVPTEAGAEFLKNAQNVLDEVDRMMTLSDPEDPKCQRFSISATRAAYTADGMSRFIAGLDRTKEISVDFVQTSSLKTINDVANGRYRLGIIRYRNQYAQYFADYLAGKSLKSVTIWEYDEFMIASKDHPLFEKDEVTRDDLSVYPKVSYGDSRVPYLSLVERKPSAGPLGKMKNRILVYDRCCKFEMLSMTENAVSSDSPIPHGTLERYGLAQKRLSGRNVKGSELLIYRQDYKLSELDKTFLSKLYEARDEVEFGIE